jgi:hypothetical protein
MTLALTAVCVVASQASAQAATYDYSPSVPPDGVWRSRLVPHNFSYFRSSTASSFPYMCIKLTRTSDGSNYGDVYCNYYDTGHHYAGDTGTYTDYKQSSFTNAILNLHEEW